MLPLDAERAASLSALLAIGCRAGATVVGLAAVRRAGELAYVFADAGLSARTRRELEGWAQRGARVFALEDFAVLTRAFGRGDARVVGVRPGHLADGVAARLETDERRRER